MTPYEHMYHNHMHMYMCMCMQLHVPTRDKSAFTVCSKDTNLASSSLIWRLRSAVSRSNFFLSGGWTLSLGGLVPPAMRKKEKFHNTIYATEEGWPGTHIPSSHTPPSPFVSLSPSSQNDWFPSQPCDPINWDDAWYVIVFHSLLPPSLPTHLPLSTYSWPHTST